MGDICSVISPFSKLTSLFPRFLSRIRYFPFSELNFFFYCGRYYNFAIQRATGLVDIYLARARQASGLNYGYL